MSVCLTTSALAYNVPGRSRACPRTGVPRGASHRRALVELLSFSSITAEYRGTRRETCGNTVWMELASLSM